MLVALLMLAVMSSRASPGFPLAEVPKAVGKSIAKALGAKPDRPAQPKGTGQRGASSFALADIPRRYLGFYADAASACRGLTWQVLAAIGKIESDHGRSSAPGVRSGVNRFGCCAGPMQFNIRNGRPSTWDTWGTGVVAQVYDPAHAVPAAARKLCGDGLAQPQRIRQDPCPHVVGSAALHVALKRYNNACWYVHEVVTLAGRYTSTAPPLAPSRDPFVRALARNKRITTTTSRGCDPRADLVSGKLDLRVQSLLAVIAERHTIRLSCLRTGHSRFVKGTTRVSNHTVWRAVDIDMVDGRPVSRSSAAGAHPGRVAGRAPGPAAALRDRLAVRDRPPAVLLRRGPPGPRARRLPVRGLSGGGLGRLPGRRQDQLDLGLGVGQRDEPGLERARGQVHAAVQHGVEEARVGGRVLASRLLVVADGVGGHEHAEQVAGALHPGRGAGPLEGGRQPVAEGAGQAVQVAVGVVVEQRQGGQAGRGGQRVPGQGAGLVDRALGGDQAQQARPARRRRPPGGRRPAPCRR